MLKKIVKIFGIVIAIPIVLLLLAIFLLYLSPVQNYAVKKATDYLSQITPYSISLSSIHLQFPLNLVVNDVVVADKGDTLLLVEQLRCSVQLMPLFEKQVEIDYIEISGTSVHTREMIDGLQLNGSVGLLRLSVRSIELEHERAVVKQVLLSDADISVSYSASDSIVQDTIPEDTLALAWFVEVAKTKLSNVHVSLFMPEDSIATSVNIGSLLLKQVTVDLKESVYGLKQFSLEDCSATYDLTSAEHTGGLDVNHIAISDLQLRIDSAKYGKEESKVVLSRFSFEEQSGLGIAYCAGKIESDSTTLRIPEFSLRTLNKSVIEATTDLPWKAVDAKLSEGRMSTKIEGRFSKEDVLLATDTSLANYFRLFPDTLLNISAYFCGNLKQFTIDEVKAEIPAIASFSLNGEMNDIAKAQRKGTIVLHGEVQNFDLLANRSDTLSRLFADSALVVLDGAVNLLDSNIVANVLLLITGDSVTTCAEYNYVTQCYDLTMGIENVSIKNLIPEIPLLNLSMDINANGKGFDVFNDSTTMHANVDVQTITYDSLLLEQLSFSVDLDTLNARLLLTSDNPLLGMDATGSIKTKSDDVRVNLLFDIGHVDLQGFGVSQEAISSSMKVSLRAQTDLDKMYRIGSRIQDLKIITPEKTYFPDTLSLSANTCADSTRFRIRSGDFRVRAVAQKDLWTLMDDYNSFYLALSKDMDDKDAKLSLNILKALLPEATLSVQCGQHNLVQDYITALGYSFETFNLQFETSPLLGIDAETYLYGFQSDSLQLDTLRFFVKQDTAQIRYYGGIRSTGLTPEQKKETFGAFVSGAVQDKGGTLNFVYVGNDRNVGARLKMEALLQENSIKIHFNPEATMFFESFSFNEDNYIEISKDLRITGDVNFANAEDAGFHFYSLDDSLSKANLSLEIFNVDLEAVSASVPFIPDIKGMLTTDVHYVENNFITLACDAHISDFVYNGSSLGNEDIALVYLPQENDAHYVDATIVHNENEVFVFNGTYNSAESEILESQMQVNRFPLQLSSAFVPDLPVQLSGYINGDLTAEGVVSSPVVNGDISFDSVYMDIPLMGGELHFNEKEKVKIEESNLLFDKFSIYAKGNNPFIVDGNIDFKKLTNPNLNLVMKATNYELLNAKRNNVSILYGKVFMNFNSIVMGNLSALQMMGKITLLGNTDVTYVMRDAPLDVNDELNNLVTFTNFSDTVQEEHAEEVNYDLGSISMNMTIEIEQGAQINADLNPSRSSYVQLKGGGLLNMNYSNESGLSLTGKYSLSNGELKYSLPVIPLKTFTISDGSYISWNGNPMNPTLNLTAIENVTTSVSVDDVARPVAFNVGVVITNSLDNMGLSFILSAPNDATVQGELTAMSEEDRSKYAVAMLITGAYLGSGGNLSATGALSSYLQNQIDNILGSTQMGVDINVGITSAENSETGGTYTDYSFSFAKRFWNNRMSIIIGGTVSDNQNQTDKETFIDNVALEWRLDNSGNRYVKLFFDKNNESILEGEITETGIGYVLRRQLSKLSDIFVFKSKTDEVIFELRKKDEDDVEVKEETVVKP